MECYSAIKNNTFESVLIRWMKLEPIIQGEVNKKVNNEHCILTYIWNLEACCWWTYLQGSNGNTDIEKTWGHGRGRRGWEQHWSIYITICKIRSIASGNLLYDAGSLNQVLCDNLEGRDRVGRGREVQEVEDICTPMTDSFCCMTENNTIL